MATEPAALSQKHDLFRTLNKPQAQQCQNIYNHAEIDSTATSAGVIVSKFISHISSRSDTTQISLKWREIFLRTVTTRQLSHAADQGFWPGTSVVQVCSRSDDQFLGCVWRTDWWFKSGGVMCFLPAGRDKTQRGGTWPSGAETSLWSPGSFCWSSSREEVTEGVSPTWWALVGSRMQTGGCWATTSQSHVLFLFCFQALNVHAVLNF